MRTAIVQVDIHIDDIKFDKEDLAVKRYDEEVIAKSKLSFIKYARKVNADYMCMHQAKWPELHPQVEIFRFLDWTHYDFVCFTDCDVIANTDENIFDHCKIDKLNYKHRCAAEIAKHGEIDFNSGVVVFGREVSPRIKQKLDIVKANKLHRRDQEHMWDMMQEDSTLGHRLPEKFNMYFNLRDYDGFIHFKGSWKKTMWPGIKDKLEGIKI